MRSRAVGWVEQRETQQMLWNNRVSLHSNYPFILKAYRLRSWVSLSFNPAYFCNPNVSWFSILGHWQNHTECRFRVDFTHRRRTHKYGQELPLAIEMKPKWNLDVWSFKFHKNLCTINWWIIDENVERDKQIGRMLNNHLSILGI